jgi:hypothetical protein
MKVRIFDRLKSALDVRNAGGEFAYLDSAEKAAIRTILKETLAGLPGDW